MTRSNQFIALYLGFLLLLAPFIGTTTPSARALPQGENITGDWSVFLPDTAGKQLVINQCFNCHDLARVIRLRGDADFWSDLVWSMVSQGADISREDADALINYFASNLGPAKPKPAIPININTASPETIQMLSPIAAAADKIVSARAAGEQFTAVNDLLKIDGITKENLEKVKPFLSVN